MKKILLMGVLVICSTILFAGEHPTENKNFITNTKSVKYIDNFIKQNKNNFWELNKKYSQTHDISLFNTDLHGF